MEMLATDVGLTENSRPIVGRATLTIVASMMLMNIAATKTTLTATFWLIRGCTAWLSPRSATQGQQATGLLAFPPASPDGGWPDTYWSGYGSDAASARPWAGNPHGNASCAPALSSAAPLR
jgi:hypothetical protein